MKDQRGYLQYIINVHAFIYFRKGLLARRKKIVNKTQVKQGHIISIFINFVLAAFITLICCMLLYTCLSSFQKPSW